MSKDAVRVLSVVALFLIVGNMRCLSACSVNPCDTLGTESRPIGKGAIPNCHHRSQPSPSPERPHTQPCSHQPVLAESGPQIKAPVFSISAFPPVDVSLEVVAVRADAGYNTFFERGPIPVLPLLASHSVLRI